MTLWGLLQAGMFSRGWFFFSGLVFVSLCGLRSFQAIVSQRLATLKRIAPIVNATHGTREEQSRRQGFIRRKSASLIVDLVSVFLTTVMVPILIVLLGATSNSYFFAIFSVIVGALNAIILGACSSFISSKVKQAAARERKERAKLTRTTKADDTGYCVRDESCMSSVPGAMSALSEDSKV
jgi:hypothetical protein